MPNADRGYRSIEAIVTNASQGDLVIQSADLYAGTWIQGERPEPHARLNLYNAAQWGAATDAEDGPVVANVLLTGLGNGPITISLAIDEDSNAHASAAGNEKVRCQVQQVDNGERDHAAFHVLLFPIVGRQQP